MASSGFATSAFARTNLVPGTFYTTGDFNGHGVDDVVLMTPGDRTSTRAAVQ